MIKRPDLLALQPETTVRRDSLVVLLTFVSLVAIWWCLPIGRWALDDAGDYQRFHDPVARNVLRGHGLVTNRGEMATEYPPGFPIVLATLFGLARLTGIDEQLWLRGFTLVALGVAAVFLHSLAASVVRRRAAMISAVLWTVCPLILWLTKQPHSEVLFLPLFYAALRGCQRVLQSGDIGPALLTGALCGFATLVRPIAVLFPILLVVVLLIGRPSEGKRRSAHALLLLLGYGLILAPWEIWVRAKTGAWVPVSTAGPRSVVDGLTFAVERDGGRTPMDPPEDLRRLMTEIAEQKRRGDLRTMPEIAAMIQDEFARRPTVVSRLYMWKAIRAWYATDSGRSTEQYLVVVQLAYVIVATIGSIQLWRKPGISRTWMLLTVCSVAYFWLMTVAALSIVRYMVPVVGLLFVPAAHAIEGFLLWRTEHRGTADRRRAEE